MNLLKETMNVLEDNGKTISDVEWCGTLDREYICDIEKLINVDYDNGFGCAEIPEDFIIVGKDFWLERHEYDGSEWWEYKSMPKRPKEKKPKDVIITW